MNICVEAAETSNRFEKNNTELKKNYLLHNVNTINIIMSRAPGYCGSFGTGYPFYVLDSNLEGNLPLIDEQIMLAAQDMKMNLESEDLLLLRHMVLSHHGRFEYGSPKLPALLEAELLHRIDDLDAAVYAVTNALQHTPKGEFTEPLLSQDGKRYYRPMHDSALDNAKHLE